MTFFFLLKFQILLGRRRPWSSILLLTAPTGLILVLPPQTICLDCLNKSFSVFPDFFFRPIFLSLLYFLVLCSLLRDRKILSDVFVFGLSTVLLSIVYLVLLHLLYDLHMKLLKSFGKTTFQLLQGVYSLLLRLSSTNCHTGVEEKYVHSATSA